MLDNMLGLVIRKAGLKIEGLANREHGACRLLCLGFALRSRLNNQGKRPHH